MLIPLRHENMTARRWPVITITLIVLNTCIFLFTHSSMDEESKKLGEVKLHLVMLAAMHPELNVPASSQGWVTAAHDKNPGLWDRVRDPNRDVYDGWDARIRTIDDPHALQQEMDSLGAQYDEFSNSSTLEKYGFVPAHIIPISYLTANFLHGGWLHLIGNMWFLWLAGFVLEDNWGRILYSVVYLIAGAAALQFHAWLNPGSMVPLVGASGAVAALMGAFLVRFPKLKIEMRWFLGIRSLLRGGYKFSAAAYWLLPAWLLVELGSGTLFGQSDGVAHWAHVGGFVFGAGAALLLKVTGLEHTANRAIEEKTEWNNAPEIASATEFFERGELDQATATLKDFLAANPDSLDACNLLQQIYWRKSDIPAYQEITIKLCSLYMKAKDPDVAWQHYDEYLNTGGGAMPADTWLELCRGAESQNNLERGLSEYEKLASTYSAQRHGLQAQIGAGRIALKLNRPDQALKFYEAAAASSVPHLDWEQTIAAGIREAKRVIASPALTTR